MGTTVLGESLASRHVDVMIDDDEVWAHYLASRQRLGSVAYYLFVSRVTISLFPFFFFSFLSSSFTFFIRFTAEFSFFYFIIIIIIFLFTWVMGSLSFFFFLHGSWALASWAG